MNNKLRQGSILMLCAGFALVASAHEWQMLAPGRE